MPTFAEAGELATYVQRPFSEGDTAAAEQALNAATGLIQAFTGQHFFLVADDVETFYPAGWNILLPELPVVSVASVTADGESVDWRLDRRTGLLAMSQAAPVTETWKASPGEVVVTYTHGFVEIPATVKGVCLDVARRALENPHGFVQRTVGDVSVSHGSHAGLAVGLQLSEREERALAPYRRVA